MKWWRRLDIFFYDQGREGVNSIAEELLSLAEVFRRTNRKTSTHLPTGTVIITPSGQAQAETILVSRRNVCREISTKSIVDFVNPMILTEARRVSDSSAE